MRTVRAVASARTSGRVRLQSDDDGGDAAMAAAAAALNALQRHSNVQF